MNLVARPIPYLSVLLALACGDDSTDLDSGGADPETSSTGAVIPGTTTAATGETTGDTTESGDVETTGGGEAVALELVVDGLVGPTAMATAPDGTMVVLDQPGTVYRIDGGTLQPFGDFGGRVITLDPAYDERGLLGLAFHPDYPDDPRVYVYYSAPISPGAPEGFDHTNLLAEVFLAVDGTLDMSSERQLGAMHWPQANHNGGGLAFGPDDRLLYLGLGDGGGTSDIGLGHPARGNGQDWTTLLGSIIRIDPEPDRVSPFTIPPDNPFLDEEGADPLWAFGFRDPYALSFDAESGELFVGDVGEELMEEVDRVEAGRNYGWNLREGTLCHDPNDPGTAPSQCDGHGAYGEELVPPILTYTHPDSSVAEMSDVHGLAVIGGRIYRGAAIPSLAGAYVFGDWSRSAASPEGQLLMGIEDGGWSLRPLAVDGTPPEHLGMYVRGFGQDLEGELYVLTSMQAGPEGSSGAVWRIVPSAG